MGQWRGQRPVQLRVDQLMPSHAACEMYSEYTEGSRVMSRR